MKPIPTSQTDTNGTSKLTGTGVGTAISLVLLVAFGLSSYLNQQDKDINHATAEHSNRPTVISAYLA